MGIDFEAHASGYWGDPYFLAVTPDGHEVRLTENADPMYRKAIDPQADRYFLSEYAEFPAVLWLDSPITKTRELAARLTATVGAECVAVADE